MNTFTSFYCIPLVALLSACNGRHLDLPDVVSTGGSSSIVVASSSSASLSNSSRANSSSNAMSTPAAAVSSASTRSSSSAQASEHAMSSASSSMGMVAAPSITIQEGDNAICASNGKIATTDNGFTGKGYFDGDQQTNTLLTYGVTAEQNGNVVIVITYANGSANERKAQIVINDGASGTIDIAFPTTGTWTHWQNISANVFLNGGDNTISLLSTNAKGLPNIDALTLTGQGIKARACVPQ